MNMELNLLLEEVKQLAVDAGRFLCAERATFRREEVEQKAAHDYVSYVDKASEKMIVDRLRALLPGSGFVAEEGSAAYANEDYCWLVDPLDGTTNYIHDHAPYCVSIGLQKGNEMQLGVVYECTRNELFWATKDSPAYLNGREIHVSAVNTLDQAFIELGFPYDAERFRPFVNGLIGQLYGRVGGLRLLGCAAGELCYLAAGRFEARVEGLLGPWDIAAGSLIVQRAGGQVTDFSGGLSYGNGREVFASNGLLHQELLNVIQAQKK
ncbi:MAG: inositol monophosphatase [Clostridium sp.]|nr:inositol monophosphatase [Clostridium sp.]